MGESDDVYKAMAQTQGEIDKNEIKERNRKSMIINSMNLNNINEKDDTDIILVSPGIVNYMFSDEEKIRKIKETARILQEDINVGLRIDPNGDTVTRRGKLVYDRSSQAQSIDEWKNEIKKYKNSEAHKTHNKEIFPEEKVKK